MDKDKTEIFIEKARSIHGDKYSYYKTVYGRSNTDKVIITCEYHGDFLISPAGILAGRGCAECGKIAREKKRSLRELQGFSSKTEWFISKAKEVHGDKYDYSKVEYGDNQYQKVIIICKTHGEFLQRPSNHLSGFGCEQCANHAKVTKRITKIIDGFSSRTEWFISKSKEVHGNKYDYSKVEYGNNQLQKVIIICKTHGEFSQDPKSHISGNGCPECGKVKVKEDRINILLGGCSSKTEWFITKSLEIHNGKYDYSKVKYGKDQNDPVEIICPTHGVFEQSPNAHMVGKGCSKCVNLISKAEEEVNTFIKSLGFTTKLSLPILDGKDIDIYIPDKKIGIEFNGLYWHSKEKGKNRLYHLNKTEIAEKLGIRLIHIFEDEWLFKRDIILLKLKSILEVSNSSLYARKLQLRKISFSEVSVFYEKTHIQGKGSPSIDNYGLYSGEYLVASMSFGNSRFEKGVIELLRYSSSNRVVGGFSRLLKAYLRDNPSITKIISYSDKRWTSSTRNVYLSNGFTKVGVSAPGYFYVKGNRRYNRFTFMKHKLEKTLETFDSNKTEAENMSANGYLTIYDCGMDKWEFKR